jgi:hypothetical protein
VSVELGAAVTQNRGVPIAGHLTRIPIELLSIAAPADVPHYPQNGTRFTTCDKLIHVAANCLHGVGISEELPSPSAL